MKQLLKIMSFAICGTISFSCQENENMMDEISPKVSQIDDPISYTTNHFLKLGTEIAKLASDEDFRSLMYEEVGKQFDGDNNVLLQTLAKKLSNSNSRIANSLESNEVFHKSLKAFKDIEGSNYFPQIYIPYFEELKKKNQSTNGRIMNSENDPLFVLFTGDDTQDVFNSYQR